MVNFYRENMESGKNIIMVCLAMLGCTCYTVSQNYISGTVYNNGNAYCSATLNNAGTFVNKTGGNFYVTGDITNSGTTAYDGGTLLFAGNTMQSSGGSAIFYTTNVSFNNSAGIAVSKCMSVNSTATFASGLVTTPSGSVEPLEFTSPAVSAGTSNASHVNGYVRKLGTGAFTYPVGDASMYQQVIVNPSANASGMVVKYFAADAGTAPFGTTGTDPTPLQYYNHLEYWTISPVTSATGVVTIFWDSYNNQGIGAVSDLRVAHLTGGQWLNEGTGSGAGTIASGSVTSNALSAWSPFTLGSLSSNSPLPIELTDFSASASNCQVSLVWHAATEINFDHYELQTSTDAINFTALTTLPAKGNNSSYAYQYNPRTQGTLYYRLEMVSTDGSVGYSHIISADVACGENEVHVSPVPTSGMLNISTGSQSALSCRVSDNQGRVIRFLQVNDMNSQVDLGQEQAGIYSLVLTMADGSVKTFKIIKIN